MALDITTLRNALACLEKNVIRFRQDPADTIISDSLIKRFEFTYEDAVKTLKRALQAGSLTPDQYNQLSLPDIIRSGNDAGLLLSEWPTWKQFRDMRNKTSHAYDKAIALAVAAEIPNFLPDAVFLRDRIIEKDL